MTLQVHGRETHFLVDTKSSVSIMSRDDFKQRFSETCPLEPVSITLSDYSKQPIAIRAVVSTLISYKGCTVSLALNIANDRTLLGLDAVAALKLQINGYTQQCTEATPDTDIKRDFPQLFSPGLGFAHGYMHQVKI